MNRRESVVYAYEKSKLSKTRFAEEMGLSRGHLYNWLSGRNDPHVSNVEAAAAVIDQKVNWINKSQTECEFVDVLPGDDLVATKWRPHGATFEPPDITAPQIPIIAMVSAGTREFEPTDGFPPGAGDDYMPRPYDLKDITAFGLRITSLQGDSMEPLYRPNDVVICSPTAMVRNGDDVVVKFTDNAVMLKRIKFLGGDNIRLISLNENEYPTLDVDKDELIWFYKVVYVQKK